MSPLRVTQQVRREAAADLRFAVIYARSNGLTDAEIRDIVAKMLDLLDEVQVDA